jgi:hypothetical protein
MGINLFHRQFTNIFFLDLPKGIRSPGNVGESVRLIPFKKRRF